MALLILILGSGALLQILDLCSLYRFAFLSIEIRNAHCLQSMRVEAAQYLLLDKSLVASECKTEKPNPNK